MNYEPFSRYDSNSPRRRGAGEQVKRHLPFKRAKTRVLTEGCSTGGPGGTTLKRSEFLDCDKINGFLFHSNADRAGMCSSSSLLANFSTQARQCKIKYCVPCLFVVLLVVCFVKQRAFCRTTAALSSKSGGGALLLFSVRFCTWSNET